MNRLGLRPNAPRALYIASASLLSIAAATPAVAAQPAAQPADQPATQPTDQPAANQPAQTGTPDIVVTAQFREQRLQDTPLSITAVPAQLLEQRGQSSLAEVTNQAPNVQLRQAGSSFGDSLTAFVRGVGQADFDPALEPGVGMYIDDVYYSSLTGANFELLDLERVEVLRGPQGTLQGRNSEGGTIRLISRRPDANPDAFLEVGYGSRNLLSVRGGTNFTIADGLYARISGTARQQDGYVDRIDYGCSHPGSGVPALRGAGNCVIDRQGGIGHTAVRGQLRYHPNTDIDIMLSADYTHIDQTSTAGVLTYANLDNPNTNPAPGVPFDSRFICGRFCNYAQFSQPAGTFQVSPFGQIALGLNPTYPMSASAGDDRQRFDGWNIAGNIDWHLADHVTLQSITAYREWKIRFNSDDDQSPANINLGNDRLSYWFFSQEGRLNADLASNLQLTVGGYYSDQRTTYYTLQDIRYVAATIPGFGYSPFFPLQFVGNDPVNSNNWAAFGTAIWHPVQGLTLTGGLRYTEEHKDYTYRRLNYDGTRYSGPNGAFAVLDGTTANYDGHRLDWRGSIDYRFSPAVLAYATVSTGFKGGGTNPRPFNAAQARSFNPETLTNYEIGLKTDLFNRAVRFNISAFYDRFTNIQIPVLSCPQFGGPGPCALPENAGNANITGVELETFIHPTQGLTIDGSLSYIHFKYRCVLITVVRALNPGETDSCSSDPTIIGTQPTPPPGIPAWKWSWGIQYEIPAFGGTLTPRFDMSYQSHQNGAAGAGPLGAIAGYTLANARLTWRTENNHWQIAAEVSNLFDKYYYLNNFDLRGAGAGFISAQPGHPREWTVTITRRF